MIPEEMEPAVVGLHRIDPHGCRAAANQRRIGLQRIGHWFEIASEVDQKAVAVVGFEEVIFLMDIG